MKLLQLLCTALVPFIVWCNPTPRNEAVKSASADIKDGVTIAGSCSRDGNKTVKTVALDQVVFFVTANLEKTSVSICVNGSMKPLVDTLGPLSAEAPPPYIIERIGNDSCLIMYTYSGGAGCCYGVAVFRSAEPHFMGFIPTYQSIAEVKDVDRDGLNELIVRDYAEFPGLSGDDPVPPQVAYTITDGVLVADKGEALNQFYLAEAQNYRSDIDSLLKGDCSRYNRLSLQMYSISVKKSGDIARMHHADSLAVQVRCPL